MVRHMSAVIYRRLQSYRPYDLFFLSSLDDTMLMLKLRMWSCLTVCIRASYSVLGKDIPPPYVSLLFLLRKSIVAAHCLLSLKQYVKITISVGSPFPSLSVSCSHPSRGT